MLNKLGRRITLSTKKKQVLVGTLCLAAWSPARYRRAGGDQGKGMPTLGRFGVGAVGSSVPVPRGGLRRSQGVRSD